MDSIELRSEKVRSIIGKIPPAIIRNGTFVLFVVFLVLIVSSYFFPYSETISVPVRIKPDKIVVFVPIDLQSKVVTGLQVMVEVEGYNKNTYGQIGCKVKDRIDTPFYKEKRKSVAFNLLLDNGLVTSNGRAIPYYNNMQGTATIILKKERLLKVLFAQSNRLPPALPLKKKGGYKSRKEPIRKQ